MGTSLGVDLKAGTSVEGGHRHHLKAINTIRGCGSIAKAVEQGVLTSGIFYECVRKGVPFSLAGSIRDDGPLPDTQMDLIKAQEDYARLLKGADLILMLSSMLHSIGVGNMTPAGVKLVCVDINPAVVTKLSDRGSVESVGVVTDVGLFLNLLTQQLKRMEGHVGYGLTKELWWIARNILLFNVLHAILEGGLCLVLPSEQFVINVVEPLGNL